MKTALTTLLIALALPLAASADIQSSTSASSNTGGNVVGPGGKVLTGSVSASASVTNMSGQSTSSVYIKTNSDGEVEEQSYTSNSSHVQVSVDSTPTGTTVHVGEGSPAKTVVNKTVSAGTKLEVVVPGMSSSSVTAAATTSTTIEPASLIDKLFDWIGGLFGWFI